MIDSDVLQGVLIPFVAVGLAEVGDKTQLSVLLLSSRTQEYFKLLMGVLMAFLIVDGLAILLGSWVTAFVPLSLLKLTSAAVFIAFGILILIKNNETAEEEASFKGAFVSGFSLIFVSEWGDKTQIASALFAAEYGAGLVLVGTMLALALLSIIAIYLGRLISERVDRRFITRAAGVTFIIIGSTFALSLLNFSAFAEML
jgi:putative Ca2+/H+ antiporter (TMEM165/GDT1 family)